MVTACAHPVPAHQQGVLGQEKASERGTPGQPGAGTRPVTLRWGGGQGMGLAFPAGQTLRQGFATSVGMIGFSVWPVLCIEDI